MCRMIVLTLKNTGRNATSECDITSPIPLVGDPKARRESPAGRVRKASSVVPAEDTYLSPAILRRHALSDEPLGRLDG
ncbi:hypothetical protein E2C01_005687 [Portunus trituberculatus]|uniref:Uncharacterized protein n=1 Tax=Portunus trituberculatus TaxID=210409 RepID=A0A5B7CU37_PORTR|nr:hypothetical protein [Portunus trituberculatus]